MLTVFCIVAAVLFLLLFVIWSKGGFLNFFLKFLWLLMAVWAIIISLLQLGYLK